MESSFEERHLKVCHGIGSTHTIWHESGVSLQVNLNCVTNRGDDVGASRMTTRSFTMATYRP